MRRFLLTACALAVLTGFVWAQEKPKAGDKPKAAEDSPLVKKTRMKLEEKISVEFKDDQLKDVLDELGKLAECKFRRDPTIPGHKRMNFKADNKPVKDILDEMFKTDGFGYIIHRAENNNDRYEGWVDVVVGNERGDPLTKGSAKPEPAKTTTTPKAEPKKPEATPPSTDEQNEKAAASRLKIGKQFLEDGQKEDAKEYFEAILKKYPTTKAAEEAKKLLEKIKK